MEGVEEKTQNHTLAETFCSITSSSKEEALFYLESHNWELDSAVHSFFDNNTPLSPPLLPQSPPPDSSPTIPATFTSAMASRDKKPSSKPSGSGRKAGIRTLSDLNRPESGSDSDSDGPQEYYTGGEKSGMLVQDPSKGNNQDVDAIFDQARQLGAMEGPASDHLRPSLNSRSFTGTGRLLSGESVPTAPQQPENVINNIVFWSNGFTVNDGPLRRLDDPENASFLESIRKSECPKELEPADRRSQVHVNLVRRNENCPEPEKHHVPFQGVGRTLGGGSTSTPVAPEQTILGGVAPTSAPPPSVGLYVDDSLPSTSIQLRLSDGTRMVARFNYHHTVADIRGFIGASRPGGTRAYQLQTVGFPPKQLTNMTETIEQAGLANSVVIQKL
ncbi:plant UBX domain-containing protein 4-like [Tasmannia lanceolata]|uniref:plant UBX domain-containing protein 4-like n=1 Tax=Tasmannia lanceolata TaxID=3420 RepID=UPI0040646E87